MRSACILIVLIICCSSTFAQKISYTVNNGVHIAGVDQTNPVIYDNDLILDTPDSFFMWLKAHKGEVRLVGNINTRDMYGQPNYMFTHDVTFREWVDLHNRAQQSGLQNIPAPIKGTSIALVRPASGVIEQTQFSSSPGVDLIISEAHKASPQKPLVIIVGGNVSSVANAYLKDNSIASNIVVLHFAGYRNNSPTYNTTDFWSSYVVMKRMKYVNWAGNNYEYYDNHKPFSIDLTGMPNNPFTEMIRYWYSSGYFAVYKEIGDSPLTLYFFNHSVWRNVTRRLENDQITTSDTFDYLMVSDNDFAAYPAMIGAFLRDPASYSATPSNSPPSINLTGPANNANFAAGSNITLTATAADTDGSIARVEFFYGTTKLGEDLSSPYSFSWNNVPAGSYSLTARATDNQNANRTSSAVTITVTAPNSPPSVALTAPANNASFPATASVTLTANASDNGSITKVEFYNGATKLGEDASSPYSFVWAGVPAGTYSLTAKATDNQNAVTTSSAATITVIANNVPPTVALTAPANNASFPAAASVTLTANASDSDGSIAKVEFYRGATKIGEDTSSPYSFIWTGVAAGTYSITAKATDNQNAVNTTSASTITVIANNVPPTVALTAPANNASFAAGASITLTATASDNGSITKVEFYNGTTKLGEDASSPYSFVWAGVPAGTYSLTAKATDNQNAVNTTSASTITVIANNVPPTVTLSAPSANASFIAGSSITLTAVASDPDGTVSKVEFFSGTTKLGEDATSPYSFVWNSVVAGNYELTAKATDNKNATTVSSKVNISVKAANALPTVAITSPSNHSSFPTGTVLTFVVSASDGNGSITKVEFYNGAVKLGEDTSSPYSFDWNNIAPGSYAITAKATDNDNAVTTSEPVTITIKDTVNPTANAGDDVFLTLPENSVTLNGSGTSADGSTLKYSWLQVSGPTTVVIADPASEILELSSLTEGVYTLELSVTDGKGLTGIDQIKITVAIDHIVQNAIPRYFTPNGDGVNDFWEWPQTELFEKSILMVFDKFGKKVYDTSNYDNTWDGKVDGKPLGEDAYYYVIRLHKGDEIRGAVRIVL